MTMIRSLIFIGLSLLLFLPVQEIIAQEWDFGSWWELELDKELDRGIDLGLELEQRFRDNSSRFDRSLATLSASGSVHSLLGLGGGARILAVKDPENGLEGRFRIHLDATGRVDLPYLDLRLRSRLQYGFEEFVYFADLSSNTLVNRIRLKASHAFFGTRYAIFASAESWGLFGNLDGRFLKRMRYASGLRYSIDLASEMQLRLIVEDQFHQVRPKDTLVLVLGYSRTL